MSYCPTAPLALEHDTARPLEMLQQMPAERVIPLAAVLADGTPDDQPSADEAAADSGPAARVDVEPRDSAREALEKTCLTVKRIAAELGMPRATLEAYRLGTRRMPTHTRVRLGTYLAAHAEMLNHLADELGAVRPK